MSMLMEWDEARWLFLVHQYYSAKRHNKQLLRIVEI